MTEVRRRAGLGDRRLSTLHTADGLRHKAFQIPYAWGSGILDCESARIAKLLLDVMRLVKTNKTELKAV